MRRLVTTVFCVGLLAAGGCATDDSDSGSDGNTVPSDQGAAEEPTGPAAPEVPGRTETTGTFSSCEQIVLGIDAFNVGDYDETVERFEAAIALAEDDLARAPDSATAQGMLDAVTYYAELAPEDYPSASATSAEFERWKTLTLTQCAYAGPPPPSDTGIPA